MITLLKEKKKKGENKKSGRSARKIAVPKSHPGHILMVTYDGTESPNAYIYYIYIYIKTSE